MEGNDDLTIICCLFNSSHQVSWRPDATTHSIATSGPEPETHDDRLFLAEPSLPMDRHGSRRGCWL